MRVFGGFGGTLSTSVAPRTSVILGIPCVMVLGTQTPREELPAPLELGTGMLRAGSSVAPAGHGKGLVCFSSSQEAAPAAKFARPPSAQMLPMAMSGSYSGAPQSWTAPHRRRDPAAPLLRVKTPPSPVQ